jgi:hypothetical protein
VEFFGGNMQNNKEVLEKLKKSKFRSSFHLKEKDIIYIKEKGLDKIEEHCIEFIKSRLSLKVKNDGKQTPMHGHPVFIAQHATATCCRGCLFKWHHIALNKELTCDDVKYIVNLVMEWIKIEYSNYEKINYKKN